MCTQADLNIINAEVIRNDPTELCEAGLCPNGPQAAWGHTWSFTMVTNQSIIAATSPTDHHPTLQTTLPTSLPVLTGVNVTSSVVGAFAVCGRSHNPLNKCVLCHCRMHRC